MQIHEKIRMMREINQWTQEELAEKLNISPSGYAKIERGENSINIERLEQIANVFNIDVWELMKPTEKYCIFQIIHKDNQTISDRTFYFCLYKFQEKKLNKKSVSCGILIFVDVIICQHLII